MKKSGRDSRIVDHCRKSIDIEAQRAFGGARYVNGGAHYRRSPDGNMEARTVEGVQKDATQGRKPEKPWKGRSFTNFSWGYFTSNTSPPTFEFGFRMKKVQRNFYNRSCFPRFLYSIVSRYFGVWRADAGAFSNQGDSKRFFQNSH